MESPTLTVGGPVEARCTKCRKNTDHMILVMEEEAPIKVECGVCKRQHKYRPPTVPKKAATRRTVDPTEAERKEWEGMRAELEAASSTDYAMDAAFKVKTVINHPTFGLGLVLSIIGPQKMEVLFADGKKKMRCK